MANNNIINDITLLQDICSYTKNETSIRMPNEIFDDLHSSLSLNEIRDNTRTSFTHSAFSYSYLFFTTYLYLYSKYNNNTLFTQSKIKECLGFSPQNKKVDYLIKAGGLLDQLGYTQNEKDFPTYIEYLPTPRITMFSDYLQTNKQDFVKLPPRFSVKKPLKCFHRTNSDKLDGTLYCVKNTHTIDIKNFFSIITNKELGTTGFYLYAYMLSSSRNNKLTLSYKQANEKIGLSTKHMSSLLKSLEKINLLSVCRKAYLQNTNGTPNIYHINR